MDDSPTRKEPSGNAAIRAAQTEGADRPGARERVPSVRSDRRPDGRGGRPAQAAAHILPSGAGFRSTDWREETTSYSELASKPSARGRSGRSVRSKSIDSGAESTGFVTYSCQYGSARPSRGEEGERATPPHSGGTDSAASPNPCSRSTQRSGRSGASFVHDRPRRFLRRTRRRSPGSRAAVLRASLVVWPGAARRSTIFSRTAVLVSDR